jgi:hypothetical protein
LEVIAAVVVVKLESKTVCIFAASVGIVASGGNQAVCMIPLAFMPYPVILLIFKSTGLYSEYILAVYAIAPVSPEFEGVTTQ